MEIAYAVVFGLLALAVRLALSRLFRRLGPREGLLWVLALFLIAAMMMGLFDRDKKRFLDECQARGGGYFDCQREYGRSVRNP